MKNNTTLSKRHYCNKNILKIKKHILLSKFTKMYANITKIQF